MDLLERAYPLDLVRRLTYFSRLLLIFTLLSNYAICVEYEWKDLDVWLVEPDIMGIKVPPYVFNINESILETLAVENITIQGNLSVTFSNYFLTHWDRGRDNLYWFLANNVTAPCSGCTPKTFTVGESDFELGARIPDDIEESGWYNVTELNTYFAGAIKTLIPRDDLNGSHIDSVALAVQGTRPSCVFRKVFGDAKQKFIDCDSTIMLQNTSFSSSYPFIATPEFELISLRIFLPTAAKIATGSGGCEKPVPAEVESYYYVRPAGVAGAITDAQRTREAAAVTHFCAFSDASFSCQKKDEELDTSRDFWYFKIASDAGGKCPCLVLKYAISTDPLDANVYQVQLSLMRLSESRDFTTLLQNSTTDRFIGRWILLLQPDESEELSLLDRSWFTIPSEKDCPGYDCDGDKVGSLYCPCRPGATGDNACNDELNCYIEKNICIEEAPPATFQGRNCSAEQSAACIKTCGGDTNRVLDCDCNQLAASAICAALEDDSLPASYTMGMVGGLVSFAFAIVVVLLVGWRVRNKMRLFDYHTNAKETEIDEIKREREEEAAKPLKPSKFSKKDAQGVALVATNMAYQAAADMAYQQAAMDAYMMAAAAAAPPPASSMSMSMPMSNGDFGATSSPTAMELQRVSRVDQPLLQTHASSFAIEGSPSLNTYQDSSTIVEHTGIDHICNVCQQNYATEDDLLTHKAKRNHY